MWIRELVALEDDTATLDFQGDPNHENGRPSTSGREVGRVTDGIVYLKGWSDTFGSMDLPEFRRQGWIPRNWERRSSLDTVPGRSHLCDLIAGSNGTMMEIAAGPGGGFFPNVLMRNPKARILINDRSAPVLIVWRELLAGAMPNADLCFGAFDATLPVLRTGCLDVVFGAIPFSSTADGSGAVAQAYRSLRSRGTAYIEEHVVSTDDWMKVPEEARTPWETRNPGLTAGYAGILSTARFEITLDSRIPGRQLRTDEGGLPECANQYGVLLHIERNILVARKS